MKRIAFILVLATLLLVTLVGCDRTSRKKQKAYHDDFFCATDQYEPIDLGYGDHYVVSFDVIGMPEEGVKAAAWDSYDIKLRCKYDNNDVRDYPLKVVNFPIEMRHFLGEVGEHTINLLEQRYVKKGFTVKIIENPDWDGFICRYYDRNKKLLYSEKVGFYGSSSYKGEKAIPEEEEDENYLYRFVDWKYDTDFIRQDMQFIATYDKIEKRLYAVKPYDKDYVPIVGKVDESKENGGALIYLGRVSRVAAIYGEAKELIDRDVVLSLPEERFDFPSFFLEYNRNIVENVVEYVNVPQYNQHVYGPAGQIVSLANFGHAFASDYRYDWDQKVYLSSREDVTISRKAPYNDTLRQVVGYLHNEETVSAADNNPGFYRIAVVGSFDVYVDVSFRLIGPDQYEIGTCNEWIIAPVADTFSYAVQYSEDGEFGCFSDKKLSLSTEALYNSAKMIDWGQREKD